MKRINMKVWYSGAETCGPREADEGEMGSVYEQPALNEVKPGLPSVSIHLCREIAAQKERTSS